MAGFGYKLINMHVLHQDFDPRTVLSIYSTINRANLKNLNASMDLIRCFPFRLLNCLICIPHHLFTSLVQMSSCMGLMSLGPSSSLHEYRRQGGETHFPLPQQALAHVCRTSDERIRI